MKPWGFIILYLLISGCSPYKDAPTIRTPGNHILSDDKTEVKKNMKLQKEQAKMAQKKRDELEYLNGSNTNSENLIKKKKKK